MSLIKCPECYKDVSDKAESCPNCGFSIRDYRESLQKAKSIEEEKEKLKDKMNRELKEIDNLPKPIRKPTISDAILSGNRWVFLIVFIIDAISIIGLLYYLIAYGLFSWALLIFSIILSLLVYAGWSDIKTTHKSNLEDYMNFDGYKEKRKNQVRNNYELQLKRIDSAATVQKPSEPSSVNVGLRCPVCKSSNVRRISTTSRVTSVAMVGLASSKIGKQYECKNCKHKW